MDVNVRGCNNISTSTNIISATLHHHDHDHDHEHHQNEEDQTDLRRGPWTVEEDLALINYIANHGEGRWNSLARCAGLRRTGKSCRLRWLNYLRPDVRRGNITLEEQLLILELHSRWGNRWSKIAQHLPGRTDNEIKNYWRTRVQKHAKQLQCDVNSKQFKDTMRYLWMPRLLERIRASSSSSSTASSGNLQGNHNINSSNNNNYYYYCNNNNDHQEIAIGQQQQQQQQLQQKKKNNNPSFTSENSSTATSSDSDLKDYYSTFQADQNNNSIIQNNDNSNIAQTGQVSYPEFLTTPSGYFNQGLGFQGGGVDQNNGNNTSSGMWLGGEDTSENLWNVEDMWFFQQQLPSGF